MRNIDLAAELGAKTYVVLGRPRGRRGRRRQGRPRRARPLPRGDRHCSRSTSIDQGYDLRFALEPKPNEPRGDILLPTVGHALAFINELEHARAWSASTPRSATSRWPGLNFAHGIAQALWHGKLFHIDLNGQHGPQVRPGPGLRPRRPAATRSSSSTCSRTGAATTARGTSTTSRCAPRTSTGVWASAAANMRTYLLLKEQAARVPRRPRGPGGARGRAGSPSWPSPTLAAGETLRRRCSPTARVRGLRRRRGGRARATASSGSTSSPSSTCSAPAEPMPPGRRGRLARRSRARSWSATPTPARWSAQGRAPHPDGTEVDPDALVGRARARRSTAAGGLDDVAADRRSAASSTAWSCLDDAGEVVRPALLWNDTRSAPAPPPTWSPSSAAPAAWAEAVGIGAGRRRSPSPSCAGWPSTSRTTPPGSAAVCLPHDWLTWRLPARRARGARHRPRRRLAAPATGRRPPASTGRPAASWRSAGDAALPRGARPGRGRRATPPAGARCSARAPATTWPPRSGSARGPATWSSRSAPPARSFAVARAPDRRPDRHRRRVRRRDRPVPAAGLHAQRGPGARRRRRAARRRPRRAVAELALSRRRAPAGWCCVPYLEGERTPNRPDATGALHGLTPGQRRPRRTWPGPRSRACSAALADGARRAAAPRAPGPTGCCSSAAAPGRRRCGAIAPAVFGRPVRRAARRASTSPTARPARPPGSSAAARAPGWEAGRHGAVRGRPDPGCQVPLRRGPRRPLDGRRSGR